MWWGEGAGKLHRFPHREVPFEAWGPARTNSALLAQRTSGPGGGNSFSEAQAVVWPTSRPLAPTAWTPCSLP